MWTTKIGINLHPIQLKKERKEKSQKWRRKGEANAITINYHQVQNLKNLSSERSKEEKQIV
jgi:hypothetical protein